MTNAIVEEKLISFKTLEQELFKNGCKITREHTKNILESYDDMLSKERDASKYRNKGKRKTSIKTVYGEVEYERRVYQTRLADGTKAHVYLLDRHMGMEKIGLISTNLAEKIANSEAGADNLAKLLCRKENKNLIETVERYSESLIFDESLKEIKEPLSASKSPCRDGKGLPYMEVSRGSLPLTGTPLTAGRKALRKFILGN